MQFLTGEELSEGAPGYSPASMAHRKSHQKGNLYGPNLKTLRQKAKLTQMELATKFQLSGWDVDHRVLSAIEQGERVLTDIELAMILKMLGATLSDLDRLCSQKFPLRKLV